MDAADVGPLAQAVLDLTQYQSGLGDGVVGRLDLSSMLEQPLQPIEPLARAEEESYGPLLVDHGVSRLTGLLNYPPPDRRQPSQIGAGTVSVNSSGYRASFSLGQGIRLITQL